ncbi:MAG: adenylate/guanylate cyclase domain-containing protein [Gammaproteobacteria bacterium]|nr:adenylate/guanylate cyclase domain-containing protein [Gammaproteobacteria bacterium]
MVRLPHYKNIRLIVALTIVLIFSLNASDRLEIPFVNQLEAYAYDARFRLNLASGQDPRIVIIDIDEKSISEQGRWPWHRNKLAALVDSLSKHYRVSMIGFDMVFSEADDISGLKVIEQLQDSGLYKVPALRIASEEISDSLQYDRQFSQSIEQRPVVLGFFFHPSTQSQNDAIQLGQLPAPVNVQSASMLERLPLSDAGGYGANLPILQRSALGAGFIDIPLMDIDGVIRRVSLLQRYQGKIYPTLSLAMLLALFENPPIELVVEQGYGEGRHEFGLESINIGTGFTIPVDETGAALIPYQRKYPAYPYISATDVIHQRVEKSILDNTIVLIGTTAAGLLDNRNTPVLSTHPGVEVHANLLAGMLEQKIMHQPAYLRGVELFLILIIAALLLYILPRQGAGGMFVTSTGLLLLLILLDTYIWNEQLIVLPVANLFFMIIALYIFYTAFGYFVEHRSKQHLARLFGQYVPPEIVRQMDSSDSEDYALQGETRYMTVMFIDIRNFTHLSDELPPQKVARLLNIYLTHMTQIIHHHQGTIDKYIGDAIMAFWGAPLPNPEHAQCAVEAALEMMKELDRMNRDLVKEQLPQLQIGMGINTGYMNVGNMGSKFRVNYTVLGDAVNLASRFENMTKFYHAPIIISEETLNATVNFEARVIDTVKFTGREESSVLYQLIGNKNKLDVETQQKLNEYNLALKSYYDQDWENARSQFEALYHKYDDVFLYQMYLERIEQLETQPKKEDWDHVWVHGKTKHVIE